MSDVETAEPEGKKKRSKKGIIVPVLVLALGLGSGAFFFLGGNKESSALGPDGKPTTTTTLPGPIVRLDPITLNLADGRVLKVAIALEFLAEPKEEHLKAVVEGLAAASHGASGSAAAAPVSPLGGAESKALDLAITKLGGKSFEELSSPDGRAAAKDELNEEIKKAYHDDVVKIYFTNFVMS